MSSPTAPAGTEPDPFEILERAGLVAWALIASLLLAAFLAWVAWWLRILVPPLLLAGVIVFLLNPIVGWLERFRIPRGIGVAAAYTAFGATMVLLVQLLLPPLEAQWWDLQDKWPEIRSSIEAWLVELAARTQGTPFQVGREEILEWLGGLGGSLEEQAALVIGLVVRLFRGLLTLVLGPILAFYILADLPRARAAVVAVLPESIRPDVMEVASQVGRVVGRFLRGQVVIAFLVGLLTSFGLWIIDLPLWLVIGMIAGFFNLIPFIGPWIGGIPAVVVALTMRDPLTAVWAILVMAVVQQIESNVFGPVVMHRAVRVHPTAILVALLIGGTLFGFLGLLVAVPTAAVIKVVAGHAWRRLVLREPPPVPRTAG